MGAAGELEIGAGQADQFASLGAGREGVLIAPEAAQAEAASQSSGMAFVAGLTWPGLLRLLDRKLPGYAA